MAAGRWRAHRSDVARAAVILAVALAARLAYVALTPGYRPVYDAGDYTRIALSLAHGHGFAPSLYAPGPSALRPPLYPLLLAAVFSATHDSVTSARLVQAGLGTVTVALIGLLAGRMWGRRPALVAAALAAVLPALVVMGGVLMTEVLFTALMAAALTAALTARASAHALRWATGAGALAGLAALVRTNGAVVVAGAAVVVATGLRDRRGAALRAVGVVVAAAVAVVLPWTIRNAVAFHAFVPVSDATGLNLVGTYNDDQAHAPEPVTASWRYPPVVPSLAPVFTAHHRNENELMQQLQSDAAHYAIHHPLYVIEVTAFNSWRILGGQPSYWLRLSGQSVGVGRPAQDAWYAGWLVLAALGLIGLSLGGVRRRVPVGVWLVPLLLLVTAAQGAGEARYRTPLEVFVVLVAGAGLAELHDRRSRRKGRSITA